METNKQYPYLEINLLKIEKQLKFINWNLGKLVAFMLNDQETIKNISTAENSEQQTL